MGTCASGNNTPVSPVAPDVAAAPVSSKGSADAEIVVPAGRACKLRIIHINDVYKLKYFAKLKTFIDDHSQGHTNVLKTCGGDFLGPSLLSSLDHGVGMIRMMNAVDIDVVCFGNHECDIPYASLPDRIHEFNGAWLNSNMPAFKPALPETHTVELHCADPTQKRKVGILGFLIGGGLQGTTYRPDAFGGAAASIVPVLDAAPGCVEKLKKAHPDLDGIVALTHQDIAQDEELARMGLFDVIAGGHDHDRINDQTSTGCPVVKAGADAKYAAVIDLEWADGDAKPTVSVEIKSVKKHGAPHKKVATIAVKARQPAVALETATLIKLSEGQELSSKRMRFQQTTVGSLVTSTIRDCENCEMALVNSGAIRGEKEYSSDVSYGDLKEECPFNSTMVGMFLPGKVIAEAVRQSRALWVDNATHAGFEAEEEEASGAFQLDDKAAVNAATHELTRINDAPIDPEREYLVCVDGYDLRSNSTLKSYMAAHPEKMPSADHGRPSLQILVQHFCGALWDMLLPGGSGQHSHDAVAAFLTQAGVIDGAGGLSVSLLEAALEKVLGDGASVIVARQMISAFDRDGDVVLTAQEIKAGLQEPDSSDSDSEDA